MHRKTALLVLLGPLAFAFAPAVAYAGLPECPANRGGYTATVSGNSVIVCPTVNPNPPNPAGGCPYTTGMSRVDVATGAVVVLPLNACVPAPDDAGSGSTSCFEDECVPAGTYQYGYDVSLFVGCDGTCVGPTSGEWAITASVTSPLSSCTPTFGADISAPFTTWTIDAGVDDTTLNDGALTWSGTCQAFPDAGSCDSISLDGGSAWGPCLLIDAGPAGPGAVDASLAASANGSTSLPDGTKEGGSGAGGCSVGRGDIAAGSFVPLLALSLASALRLSRRRRGERGTRA
jgi:hypothetical protein